MAAGSESKKRDSENSRYGENTAPSDHAPPRQSSAQCAGPRHLADDILHELFGNDLRLEFRGFREAQVAFRESQTKEFFDLRLFAVAGHRQFADQEVAGALEHLFLAERKRLGLMQGNQVFQHSSHFKQGSGPHPVGILFEAVLPVAIAAIFGDGEQIQHLLHFAVPNHAAQAYAARILTRDHHLEAAGLDVQKVELFDRRTYRPAADLFNDTDTVVGIDDLVADVEIHIRTAHSGHPKIGEGFVGKSD